MKRVLCAAIAASILQGATQAATAVYPVPMGREVARFFNGTPTLSLESEAGAVEVTPLPLENGHAVFAVAVYNKGPAAVNFGVENIGAVVDGGMLPVLSEPELERRAKNRAMWAQIGTALIAGAAAGVATGIHNTNSYHGRVRTRGGSYAWSGRVRDNSGAVLATSAAAAGGTAGVIGIQNRLDETLRTLSHEIVQTTTIDSQASYGGRIVLEKPRNNRLPYDVRLFVNWNGESYPFVFRVTEQGRNVPPPYPAPRPAAIIVASAPAPVQPSVPPPLTAPMVVVLPSTPRPVAPLPLQPVRRADPLNDTIEVPL